MLVCIVTGPTPMQMLKKQCRFQQPSNHGQSLVDFTQSWVGVEHVLRDPFIIPNLHHSTQTGDWQAVLCYNDSKTLFFAFAKRCLADAIAVVKFLLRSLKGLIDKRLDVIDAVTTLPEGPEGPPLGGLVFLGLVPLPFPLPPASGAAVDGIT